MTEFKEIIEFDVGTFDDSRNLYYTQYFNEYYYDAFRPNQGTEVVLDILKRDGKSGKWLDLGAGPATLFWSLMLRDINELHCNELYIEGLKVLDDFLKGDSVPQCYKDVMNMYGIDSQHLVNMRTLPRKYYIFDALTEWPSDLSHNYDLITGFGVFGLTTNPEDYIRCFEYMRDFLKDDGHAIGANWIRSQSFIDKGNTDNRFMNMDLIKRAAERYDYQILHLSEERIENDENYDKVLVWSLCKL